MDVISAKLRLCTCCMDEHEVKTVHVEESTVFKNISIKYGAQYFYCDAADAFYEDESLMRSNDIAMKNAYRRLLHLLTSGEISSIRAKYNITQKDLCLLLGWGEKTITRYESHQVQDKAHDTILRKLDQDPEWFIHLLWERKGCFPPATYEKYLQAATARYEKKQDSYLRKAIQAKYAVFNSKNICNGNTILSLPKVVDTIRYFSNASAMTSLYKVKLMKLLWYADALSYKRRGHAITGLVYQALPMGAVPIGHDAIIALNGVEHDEIDLGECTAYRFTPSGNQEYPNLTEEEKNILDAVIKKFGGMSKDEIVSFMHQECAYTATPPREIITFDHAEKLSLQ